MIGGDRAGVGFLAARIERGPALEQKAAEIAQVSAIIRNRMVGRARGLAQRGRE